MSANIITPRTHLPHRPTENPEHSNQRTAPSLQRTHRQFTPNRLHPRGGVAASVKRGTSAYTGARACRTSVRSSLSSTHLHTKPPMATYPPANPPVDDIHTHVLTPVLRCSMGEAFPGARRFMGTSQPVVGFMVRGSCFASKLRDPSDACEMRWPILTDPSR
jgi:hypothetical protein